MITINVPQLATAKENPMCYTKRGKLDYGPPECYCLNSISGPSMNTWPSDSTKLDPVFRGGNPYGLTGEYTSDSTESGGNNFTKYSLNIFRQKANEQYPKQLDEKCTSGLIGSKETGRASAYKLKEYDDSVQVCMNQINIVDSNIGNLDISDVKQSCGNATKEVAVEGASVAKENKVDPIQQLAEQKRIQDLAAAEAKAESERKQREAENKKIQDQMAAMQKMLADLQKQKDADAAAAAKAKEEADAKAKKDLEAAVAAAAAKAKADAEAKSRADAEAAAAKAAADAKAKKDADDAAAAAVAKAAAEAKAKKEADDKAVAAAVAAAQAKIAAEAKIAADAAAKKDSTNPEAVAAAAAAAKAKKEADDKANLAAVVAATAKKEVDDKAASNKVVTPVSTPVASAQVSTPAATTVSTPAATTVSTQAASTPAVTTVPTPSATPAPATDSVDPKVVAVVAVVALGVGFGVYSALKN
jgi:hypothetical protein